GRRVGGDPVARDGGHRLRGEARGLGQGRARDVRGGQGHEGHADEEGEDEGETEPPDHRVTLLASASISSAGLMALLLSSKARWAAIMFTISSTTETLEDSRKP